MRKTPDNLIFGKHSIFEAIESSLRVEEIWTCCFDEIKSSIPKGISINKVTRGALDKLSGGAKHQGIVARVQAYKYCEIENIIESSKEKSSNLIVVCDHISDVHNLGAIIRSAESVGASGVVIENARSACVTPTVYKTSAGAVNHMKIAKVANVNQTLTLLKDAGYWVVGASEHASCNVWEADLAGRIVLVLGNEEKGISKSVFSNCDDTFKLPQIGKISSLNVAQASTVFMYEWVRQNVNN